MLCGGAQLQLDKFPKNVHGWLGMLGGCCLNIAGA
ncbi:hypothetical protein L345_02974, partial [Ophiophagus hannah]